MTTSTLRLGLTAIEFAALKGESRDTVYRGIRDGSIPNRGTRRTVCIPIAYVAEQFGVSIDEVRRAVGILPAEGDTEAAEAGA
ncbi:hypothetical protein [Streptomyces sp. NPDC051684]|uniref:hypothetical protein n=1 Tax=Streptomyces sp. NPDC051684 TaxID=3365670 RepID=UPI003790798E